MKKKRKEDEMKEEVVVHRWPPNVSSIINLLRNVNRFVLHTEQDKKTTKKTLMLRSLSKVR